MKIVTDNERDFWTMSAMRHYGKSFVMALGIAAGQADSENLRKIKKAFPFYWHHYEQIGIELEAHQKRSIYTSYEPVNNLLKTSEYPVESLGKT